MYLNQEQLQAKPKRARINLVNSITGIKPANLIGTQSTERRTNLAIFSSVIHLGSSPMLLGFITRPTGEVRRDTYENIKETGVFTINHVPFDKIENAHYTSAKFDAGVSEFETCGFTEEWVDGFEAPFVKESLLKVGLKWVEEIHIQRNDTRLIVGEILWLHAPNADDEGNLNLAADKSVGISGLDTYYKLVFEAQYPYAKVEELPHF